MTKEGGRGAADTRQGIGPRALANRVLAGDRRAAARLITLIENEAEGVEEGLKELYPLTGQAYLVGITGPPGSGKSTLASGLAREFRRRGKRVGILAIDPSSPFTGGAVLGDRVRMQEHSADEGVFIRSMASRGALGGLSRATADAAKVLDAFGCEVILIETVGAGQGEVDIARAADSTLVVEIPGMGDEIQAIKAGILEIADVFVVNKADRDSAARVVLQLKMLLEMNGTRGGWVPPVIKTVATEGKGVDELADSLEAHRRYLKDSGELAQRRGDNLVREVAEAAKQQFITELWAELGEDAIDSMAQEIAARRLDPRSAAKELVRKFREGA